MVPINKQMSRLIAPSYVRPILILTLCCLCLPSCVTNSDLEAEVRSLVSQGHFDEAQSAIRNSSVRDRKKKHLSALVDIGHGEKLMANGQYLPATKYFADALNNDPGNKYAARDDCLAAYRFFVNQPFEPEGSPKPNPSALKTAVEACKRTPYGSQLLPFISSNMNNRASAR